MKALIRRNRNEAKGLLERDRDRAMFDSRWGDIFSFRRPLELPKIQKREDNKNIYVEVRTPEITGKNVKVRLEDGLLSISARKSSSLEEKRKNYYRSESSEGSFCEQLYLGENTTTKAKTEYKEGRLTVTIPKKETQRIENMKHKQ